MDRSTPKAAMGRQVFLEGGARRRASGSTAFCPAKPPMPRKRLVVARLSFLMGGNPGGSLTKRMSTSRQTPDSQELGTASRRRPLFAALIPLVTPEI